jgi:hypothetical protein
MLRLLVGLVSILSAAVALGGEPAPPPRAILMTELVKQLGHQDFEQRAAASRRLGDMTLDPPPEVLAAAKSGDPEVRRRASEVAEAMRGNVVAARLRRWERFAEQGRIDLYVAASVAWDLKPDDDRLWQPAWAFGRRLIEKAELKAARKPHGNPCLLPDLATHWKLHKPRFTRVDEFYTCPDPQQETPPRLLRNVSIHAAGVQSPKGIYGIVVSRGSVETGTAIQTSVILANGDVTAVTGMYSVVIVCDGDVTVTDDHIGPAVVVARGNITARRGAATSVLVAGGKVTLGEKRFNKEHLFNVIKEDTAGALGITFFELSTVGLEVKIAGGAVTVAKVAAGGAGEKAGLKAGDVILDVGGKKPADVETLRRLLRDALAIGDASMKLKRGDGTETVKIALQE